MSRVGQAPITVPSGVDINLRAGNISVKGPKGQLERSLPEEIAVEQKDGALLVARSGETPQVRALHGLFRSLIANMVEGVTNGFEKRLEIHGVGYRATKQGNDLELAVGFSHTVKKPAPKGIEFEVPTPTRITVRGIDKELVGQTAAEIRAIKKPEPYKAKGIRYEGEHIRRKGGKAAKAGV
ncbi:MAG: large subunit ribosomal protein [Actinomycetota bacterium]|jgi:large subunit ribosomal protein L6|nr:large subunit ribosomal protein [Actinomycetota bacterium]